MTDGKQPYWIEFIGDRSVRIEAGQTILDASLRAGIPHYHDCGGNGECTTCRVLVYSGVDLLSAPTEKEALLKQTIPLPTNVRLACQTQVSGSHVRLHRVIRDEEDLALYTEKDWKDSAQTGHEQDLALFFLDIRDFTPFMEAYLPFDVIHIVRRLFAFFQQAIEQHRGRIIDTAGDGFYAVFGFETGLSAAANQAFAAARRIQSDLDDFNRSYAVKYFSHRFQAGIGLHAGRVIVGNIGIGVNNNLTVMGLPVNAASRIQAATKTLNNDLVVSESFYELLTPPPPAQTARLHLKGLRDEYRLRLCGNSFFQEDNTA